MKRRQRRRLIRRGLRRQLRDLQVTLALVQRGLTAARERADAAGRRADQREQERDELRAQLVAVDRAEAAHIQLQRLEAGVYKPSVRELEALRALVREARARGYFGWCGQARCGDPACDLPRRLATAAGCPC